MPNRRTVSRAQSSLVTQKFQQSANAELSKLVHNAENLHRLAAPRAAGLLNGSEVLSTKTIHDYLIGRDVEVISDPLQTAIRRYFSLNFETSTLTCPVF